MTGQAYIEQSRHVIHFEDNSSNEVALWKSPRPSDKLFLVLPAMGVRASFYDKFCDELSRSGCAAAVVDWRGHGKSSVKAGRRQDWGYKRLIEETAYVLRNLKGQYDFHQVYLIGHSMGGQVGHLAASRYPDLINGVVSVAASDPFYRKWKGINRLGIYVAGRLVYPIGLLVGHFPGYFFRFAQRESRTVIRDWGRAVRKGYFDLVKDNFDYLHAKKGYTGRIISIGIENDFFAPVAAIKFTLKKFSSASQNEHIELPIENSEGVILNHFNWAKHPKYVKEIIADKFLQ